MLRGRERKSADEGGGFVVTSEYSLTASSYAHACAIEVFVSLQGARDDVGSDRRTRVCLRVAFSCTITWCVDSRRFATSVRIYHLADNVVMSLQVSLIFRCGREGIRSRSYLRWLDRSDSRRYKPSSFNRPFPIELHTVLDPFQVILELLDFHLANFGGFSGQLQKCGLCEATIDWSSTNAPY